MTTKQGNTPPATAAADAAAESTATADTGAAAAETAPAAETPKPARGAKAKSAAPATAAADAAADPGAEASGDEDEVMPEANGRTDAAALNLLFDACEKFNINPTVKQRPRELAAWRYYPGDRIEGTPASVVLVTAGGVKVRHNADGTVDADTEERLRAIFRAVRIDPVTKNPVPAPLPEDLSLPAEAVLGLPAQTTHRHPGGYLRRPRA